MRSTQTTKILPLENNPLYGTSSVLKRSGASGRRVLQQFADVDLLGSFVFEVYPSDTTVAIPAELLEDMCVYITVRNCPIHVTVQPIHFKQLYFNIVSVHAAFFIQIHFSYTQ